MLEKDLGIYQSKYHLCIYAILPLSAGYDSRSILSAGYDSRSILSARYDSRSILLAGYDSRSILSAGYDLRSILSPRYDSMSIFKQSTVGLNLGLFFTDTDCLTKAKNPSLSYLSPQL